VTQNDLDYKAATPIRPDLVKHLGMEGYNLTTGAVCVYPNQTQSAVKWLKLTGKEIPVASVATGFPAGQTPLRLRLEEIREAVADGATEIDIVINRTMALQGNWRGVYDEVKQMKEACGTAHMKAILGVGELGTMENIYKASMVCMQAGSDFIKTSTGKESVNATLPIGLVMVRAIREFLQRTGVKVGFKPAGGIRTAKDSLAWLSLMKEELGNDYVKGDLFRIGASSLLIDVERQLYHYCYGRYAAAHQLAMS
jgi:deoxyribose-phosphate aldolase